MRDPFVVYTVKTYLPPRRIESRTSRAVMSPPVPIQPGVGLLPARARWNQKLVMEVQDPVGHFNAISTPFGRCLDAAWALF